MCLRNQKITFLLGAGASYGHTLNKNQNPPIMNNFLSSSILDGVLTEAEFPGLVQRIQQFECKKTLVEACQSLESSSNLEDFLGNVDLDLLQLGLFYIPRYLGKFCNAPLPKESGAYQQLASYIKNNIEIVNGIINLNYDTLLDQALTECDISFNNGFQCNQSKLFYLKPHGSLNFRLRYSALISFECTNWKDFLTRKSTVLLDNTLKGIPLEIFKPTFNTDKDFFLDGTVTYVPAIIMPTGKNKNYTFFDDYMKIWDSVGRVLKESSELIIIGCAINDGDEMLWNHLKKIRKDSKIKIVSANKNNAEDISTALLKQLPHHKIDSVDINGFHEYANKYLAQGNK